MIPISPGPEQSLRVGSSDCFPVVGCRALTTCADVGWGRLGRGSGFLPVRNLTQTTIYQTWTPNNLLFPCDLVRRAVWISLYAKVVEKQDVQPVKASAYGLYLRWFDFRVLLFLWWYKLPVLFYNLRWLWLRRIRTMFCSSPSYIIQ